MQQAEVIPAQLGEILDEAAFTVEAFAQACGVTTAWVEDRLESGVLYAGQGGSTWHVDSVTISRTRRIAQLEATYDADPQLAALTADLIEEVRYLRGRLQAQAQAQAQTR